MKEFQVNKKDLSQTRVIEVGDSHDLSSGQVKAKVEAFSFTSNNITYWAMGDKLNYWQFFPAAKNDDNQYGIIPVWGFAEVVASAHNEVPVGERLFGYFPTAQELVMRPAKVNRLNWFDSSEHRTGLAPGYNIYRRVLAESGYDAKHDDLRMLLFPLHITSFCLHDMLASQQWHGAEQIIIISASSKTSLGLAYALHEDAAAPKVIGLTSAGNQAFVESTAYYQDTFNYDQINGIDATKKTVVVDMSGSGQIISRLHSHLGENMLFSSHVGFTHLDETGMGEGYIAARSKMFFAPAHIQKRYQDWGATVFESKAAQFMQRAAIDSRRWLGIKHANGLQGLSNYFTAINQGKMPAKQGLIVKM